MSHERSQISSYIPNLDGNNLGKDKFVKGFVSGGLLTAIFRRPCGRGRAAKSLYSLSLVNQRQLPLGYGYFYVGWMAIAMIFAPALLCVFNSLPT